MFPVYHSAQFAASTSTTTDKNSTTTTPAPTPADTQSSSSLLYILLSSFISVLIVIGIGLGFHHYKSITQLQLILNEEKQKGEILRQTLLELEHRKDNTSEPNTEIGMTNISHDSQLNKKEKMSRLATITSLLQQKNEQQQQQQQSQTHLFHTSQQSLEDNATTSQKISKLPHLSSMYDGLNQQSSESLPQAVVDEEDPISQLKTSLRSYRLSLVEQAHTPPSLTHPTSTSHPTNMTQPTSTIQPTMTHPTATHPTTEEISMAGPIGPHSLITGSSKDPELSQQMMSVPLKDGPGQLVGSTNISTQLSSQMSQTMQGLSQTNPFGLSQTNGLTEPVEVLTNASYPTEPKTRLIGHLNEVSPLSISSNGTIVEPQIPLSIPGYLELSETDIRLIKVVGKGGSATLHLGEFIFKNLRQVPMLMEGEYVAVKIMKEVDEKKRGRQMETFLQEVALMQYFSRHPNMVKFYGYIQSPMAIIMKYYPIGSLSRFIHKKKEMSLEKWLHHFAYHFAQDILAGLSELHKNHIIHNDIKPANVLIERMDHHHYVAVICDFSIASISGKELLGVKEFKSAKIRGASISYAAPEVLQKLYPSITSTTTLNTSTSHNSISTKSDLYAFGVTLLECIQRQRAYPQSITAQEVIQNVLQGKRPHYEDWIGTMKEGNKYLRKMIIVVEICLNYKPDERGSAEQHLSTLS